MKYLVHWLLQPIRLASLSVLAIALTSLAGHITGHGRMYNWNNGSAAGMGINTATCFVLVSVCLFVLALDKE